MNLTLLLLTHNSTDNIQRHFDWVKNTPIIDEIIIVDDNSTDDTLKTIKSFASKTLSVKTFTRGLDNNFSTQRQYGIDQAKNDWILWLDSDEQPTGEMVKFIFDFNFSNFNYSFKRIDTFLGASLKHGETNHLRFLRLFHRQYGHFSGAVHEVWTSIKPTISTNSHILHHPHPNLKTFFSKINFYSDIRAHELFTQKTQPSLFNTAAYPLGKFIYNYFILLGFLDGTPGIIHALGMSFHSFLVRAKLWHLSQPPSSQSSH